jgi:uncharacterized membrane protein
MTRARWPDLESVVGSTLLVGVLVSVTLIAAGLAWHWIVTGDLHLTYALAATSVGDFVAHDVEQIASAAARPRLLINLGIAVLMLTPYIRVMASLVTFAVERDWKYVAFTGFVLATLTYSLFT